MLINEKIPDSVNLLLQLQSPQSPVQLTPFIIPESDFAIVIPIQFIIYPLYNSSSVFVLKLRSRLLKLQSRMHIQNGP